ncbi:2-succinyl-5-enolpyruvyl-6-hydroxy-3-cyclohexene-1-carboxylic-acid synthase [Teredinibacter sp. KSP-S5-2]|uniref:2-succinyl-5-enolpyruvyl-6-hydroxy-3- cyclohexene-1-carboxylic-acid synthase n=1 Tax=Teredinibacter sp. KSP-S5-2 TaxID=3034506 RepID=UPI002934FB52|nr:2-succinyl-5-enolpyruvyl-6-hydroxy-3-cyclohexene-1-carboxylic-acid synthase [Teredinibacter sp. KSP-S5-2]WNO09384.1 2-succinyl-5-enolpyruvyl-6-hydroxy-3-cyclohexene-1-carboxylic-acid synthase [Teredinibacter sp. KSP-S5-2]
MNQTQEYPTANEAWCYSLLIHLMQHGVRHICIAPGSRSAPLTIAAARLQQTQASLELHSHFDERGLGFFALGIAKSTHAPVVIITTSGTAVANLYPAVVEARQSHIPLIILSADRPDELQNCGANQAIRQKNLFGENCVTSYNIAPPDELEDFQKELDIIQQHVKQALQRSAGPMQLNCAFRDPLYGESEQGQYSIVRKLNRADATTQLNLDQLKTTLHGTELFITGQLDSDEAKAVLNLARKNNILILPDINSQLRLLKHPSVIHHADLLLATQTGKKLLSQYKNIVQFGGRMVSKRLLQWLSNRDFEHYTLIKNHSDGLDPAKKAKEVCSDIVQTCQYFSENSLGNIANAIHTQALVNLNNRVQSFINSHPCFGKQHFNELNIARVISQNIIPSTQLFLGNSLGIRLFDMFADITPEPAQVLSNRGASGIDGLIATTAGIQQGRQQSLTCVLGDTSLLHDLNSLQLAKKAALTHNSSLVIVVINNDGGSIFNLLPANELGKIQQDFFQMPHGLTFDSAAKQFGLTYYNPKTVQDFIGIYCTAAQSMDCSLIELNFRSTESSQLIKQFLPALAKTLDRPNAES